MGKGGGGAARKTALDRIDPSDWRFGMRLGHGTCEDCGSFASGAYDDEVVEGEADGGLYCYVCWRRYLAYKPPMKKRAQPSNEWPKPEPTRACVKIQPPAGELPYLDHDAWCCVFDVIEDLGDALRLRRVCVEVNRAFITLVKGPSDAYPAAGMIVPSQCMQCRGHHHATPDEPHGAVPSGAKAAPGPMLWLAYAADSHPQRCIISCRRWPCFRASLSRFLRDHVKERVYPWVKWDVVAPWDAPPIIVRRTNGLTSRGYVVPGVYPREGALYACVCFEAEASLQPWLHKGTVNAELVKLVPVTSVGRSGARHRTRHRAAPAQPTPAPRLCAAGRPSRSRASSRASGPSSTLTRCRCAPRSAPPTRAPSRCAGSPATTASARAPSTCACRPSRPATTMVRTKLALLPSRARAARSPLASAHGRRRRSLGPRYYCGPLHHCPS